MKSRRVFILAQLILTASLSRASERSVVEQLLNLYDKRTRPTINDSLATNVTIFPDIQNLIDMIENEETVKLLIFLRLEWRDDCLTWNPADHNGTDTIHISGTLIWQPDITVLSSLETVPVIPAEQEILQVESNGIVSVSKPVIVSNYCPMQIKNFPFDEQECPLIISPWGYTARQVTVYDSGSAIEMRGNSEWNADCARFNENIVQVKLNLYKELQYGLHFKRNPTYYVWVLILPTYLITCLSIVGIFMPNSSSGERIEKVTLGLATLLTMAVILNIVSEAMPKGADLPMLGYFVMAEIVLCIISLIVAIVIIQVHHRVSTRTHPPPEWLFTILLLTKTEQWAVKPPDNRSLSGSQIASNVIVLGKRTVSKQKSLRREPSVNTWTTSLPSDTEKTTAVPPHCASDDMRQMVTELRAYLAKLNQDEAIVGQWIRIFDRIDAVFLTTLQITNFVVSVFLLT